MNKITLKKNLLALDHSEWKVTNVDDIVQELMNVSQEEKLELARSLIKTQKLIFLTNSFDLTAPITMFARSRLGSDAEDVALFETLLKDETIRNYFLENPARIISKKNLKELFDDFDFLLPSIFESKIFIQNGKNFTLRPLMQEVLPMIIDEMSEPSYILSSPAYALFIQDQVNFHNAVMKDNKNPLPYKYQDFIFKTIPVMSVFQERSRTESLQGFYKDNLMQEFKHTCPICGINISYMLIASHIRPFRDCAHLIESSDHSNGIILCKNHDFMFDQGYITFDDNGKIIISSRLSRYEYSNYAISEDFVLPEILLSKRRRMFLDYHRKNIFIY
ncbi:MAG: HNH endonuclease [Erysipelotrichales bacterium]|nr:HNH endonuclease [Erysipelotrichales bacterium]